jgi:hypothetical protein
MIHPEPPPASPLPSLTDVFDRIDGSGFLYIREITPIAIVLRSPDGEEIQVMIGSWATFQEQLHLRISHHPDCSCLDCGVDGEL